MKKSKFTEAQMAFALKQVELGTKVEEVCRKQGISQATLYNWKWKYGGLGISELRELRQLKEENARLKRLVADLSLDQEMLKDVIEKSARAILKTGVGSPYDWPLSDIGQKELPTGKPVPFSMVLQTAPTRWSFAWATYSSDCRSAGSLWFLACICSSKKRRVYWQPWAGDV